MHPTPRGTCLPTRQTLRELQPAYMGRLAEDAQGGPAYQSPAHYLSRTAVFSGPCVGKKAILLPSLPKTSLPRHLLRNNCPHTHPLSASPPPVATTIKPLSWPKWGVTAIKPLSWPKRAISRLST
ncbi:hypothetical protein MRX96_018726 [Rhipicephalus microplus]